MGYIRHHAILVTAWDRIEEAHEMAERLVPGLVTNIVEARVNGDSSFAILPDGSKEGWEASDEGEEQRQNFIEWLNSQRYEDGSSPIKWALVQYGDDNGVSQVIAHSEGPVQ